MDRGAWWAAVHGVAKSRARLSNWAELSSCKYHSLARWEDSRPSRKAGLWAASGRALWPPPPWSSCPPVISFLGVVGPDDFLLMHGELQTWSSVSYVLLWWFSGSVFKEIKFIGKCILPWVNLNGVRKKHLLLLSLNRVHLLWDPMDCSTPGLPVPNHLPEFAQVHVHWVGDAIQPSHPLSPHTCVSPGLSWLQWTVLSDLQATCHLLGVKGIANGKPQIKMLVFFFSTVTTHAYHSWLGGLWRPAHSYSGHLINS